MQSLMLLLTFMHHRLKAIIQSFMLNISTIVHSNCSYEQSQLLLVGIQYK